MQTPVFELSEVMVNFTHMNLCQEKHGEESVLAVDLKMSFKTTNDALAMFHPALKSRLFKKPDATSADLVEQTRADELADVLTYLDLLAATLGVDLGNAAVEKFNEVSERVGFPDRIVLAAAEKER